MHPEEELTSAAATGNTERVNILLQNGVDVNGVNRFQRTPLQVMMMGSTPVARLLLEHGADPNLRDSTTGTTPLHDAARTGYLETVRLLVEFQADAQATDNNNRRPVDLAQLNGHQEVVHFLQSL
ncbi:cyclin-dependent kinase 4 inhibitor B [Alosa pseudoharengus]|uniref:cyclin-dependent kinase 4 inhibitor B n=1 Tax=Alosa pseudoharengus TaxID=34774 RepID=UPI003F8BB381